MLSILITVLVSALWYLFAKDAWKTLVQYHRFRSNRGRGSYWETIKRNPRQALILAIGVLLAIQLISQIVVFIGALLV